MDFSHVLSDVFLSVSAIFLSMTAYFLIDLHKEFKTLRDDHQKTKDRVLVLEVRGE